MNNPYLTDTSACPQSIPLLLLRRVPTVSTTFQVYSGTRMKTRPSALTALLMTTNFGTSFIYEDFRPAKLCFNVEKSQKLHGDKTWLQGLLARTWAFGNKTWLQGFLTRTLVIWGQDLTAGSFGENLGILGTRLDCRVFWQEHGHLGKNLTAGSSSSKQDSLTLALWGMAL